MKRFLFQATETATVVAVSVTASMYAARGTRYLFRQIRERVKI